MYFLKNLLLYSQAFIRKTKYVVMMTKEGSTKIVNFMTSRAGVLVPRCGHITHIVKCIISLKILLLYSEALIKQTKYTVIITKEGFTKIVTFMPPRAGVLALGCCHIGHIVKIHNFFLNLLLYSGSQIKQTKYIVMMTKEGSTKIVNFMTPGAGVLMLGHGHISHKVNMQYLLLYQYTVH